MTLFCHNKVPACCDFYNVIYLLLWYEFLQCHKCVIIFEFLLISAWNTQAKTILH